MNNNIYKNNLILNFNIYYLFQQICKLLDCLDLMQKIIM